MSMSDWTDKENGAYMVLSTDQQHEGAKSLRINCFLNNQVIKVLDKSEVDNPHSVNMAFWTYFKRKTAPGAKSSKLALFFRYQDNDNYFVFRMVSISVPDTTAVIDLGRRIAGATVWGGVQTAYYIMGNVWEHWKVHFCVISATAYAILYKEEAGNWVEKDEISIAESTLTAGGGVGVGNYHVSTPCDAAYPCYLDETSIYYT